MAWRWLGAGAVLVTCALIGAWVVHRDRGAAADPRPRPASLVAWLASPQTGADAQAAPMGRAPPPAAAAERDAVEVCGVGRYARKDLEDPRALHALVRGPAQDAVRRTLERLQAGSDDRSRAAADLLVWSLAREAAAFVGEDSIAREGLDCSKDAQRCNAPAPASPVQREAFERLVRSASVSSDAWVYGLAYQVCHRPYLSEPVASCQLISVARWAQLEPDNAVPWLHAAHEAQQRKDSAAVDEALYRAAHAPRNDVRWAQSVLQVRAGMPADVAPFVGWGLDMSLMGTEASFVLPPYTAASSHCPREALGDPNRRALCDDLARLLIERSTTLLDLGVGIGMAKRLGWAAQQLAPHEELRAAMLAEPSEASEAGTASPSPWGCATVNAQRERLGQVGLQGELAAQRAWVDASPLGRAGLAARHRAATAPAAASRTAQPP